MSFSSAGVKWHLESLSSLCYGVLWLSSYTVHCLGWSDGGKWRPVCLVCMCHMAC